MKDIATKTTTTYILEKYHLHALKKYGQNFLIDTNVIDKIITSASLDKDSCVIEIGPGMGALTQILSRSVGLVRSYEIDVRFKPVYKEFLQDKNIQIIFEDFLKIDLQKEVKQLKQTYKKVCIVANLPYYITSAIIEKAILSNSGIDCMVVMVQKEVALKMTSDYKNPLTLLIDDIGTKEYMFTVSKHVFMPAPHVDSAILKITLEKEVDPKLYDVLTACFIQRRKTIYNNLKEKYDNALQILEKSNIKTNARSEELSIIDFKEITKHI